MSRRLDIELTSQRDEHTWTWRAAGARQPKGEVRSELLPDSAAVGSVLRAEAEGGLDGLEIISVMRPKTRAEPTDRLELIQRASAPAVTTTLAPKTRRGDRKNRRFTDDDSADYDERRERGRKKRNRRDRAPSDDAAVDGDRPRGPRGRDRGDRRDRRKPGRDSGRGGERRARDAGSERGSKGRGERRDHKDQHRSERPKRSARPRGSSLKARRVHRRAALEALPDDQQPLAREVLNGGVPGVRHSIERMNAKAVDADLPRIKADPILALAERLTPVLKAAEWRDRAEAALAGIDKIDLREIRSVVAAADRAARTDETRALAENLKKGFNERLEADQSNWLAELASTIGEGRTIRALRLSSWPPKAGTPLPVDMAERLAALAASDLSADTNQQRWATVMDAVSFSPVRTQVTPAGVPEKPNEELLAEVRRLAPRVPQIAALFGVAAQAPDETRTRAKPVPAPPADEPPEPAPAPASDPVAVEAAAPESAETA
ncbi:MAG: hypothetical protein OXE79_09175 [Acidimicrobiaceae bacterium]|nr:hypothetical protein [Acidimicrobiaceae bacterium]MCY4176419.1 hypothetical protein [Acidimicrobiaceae bacterium]MCY4280743.1 hypothetical protein [Acidimicrobiaceae bacterium]MCY4295205.1 hypothetical protein [Acidimicrobiaceae bacterium]